MSKYRNDNINFILNKVRALPCKQGEPAWMKQLLADLERHEGYREYAYPDPLSEWGKKYRNKSYKWGYRPASAIMAELGLRVEDIHKGAPWTVGIGFTKNVKYTSRTTRGESYARLEEEVLEHAKGLDSLIPGWRTEQPYTVQTVLVNMIYNMGTTKLAKFAPTLQRIKDGKYAEAASRIEKTPYCSQVGARCSELMERLRTGKVQDKYAI